MQPSIVCVSNTYTQTRYIRVKSSKAINTFMLSKAANFQRHSLLRKSIIKGILISLRICI